LPNPSLSGPLDGTQPVNPLANPEIKAIQPDSQQAVPANSSNANVGAPKDNQQDPDPSAVTTIAKPPDSQDPPPVVDIKLSDPTQTQGSDMAINANGLDAMVRSARGQYQVGNYQTAANTYERALKAGADPATVNQRLGQCYEKLGRNSDAADAYSRAIAALQNQINGGKGNKDRLLAALDSSRQALKNLQGG
jgi:hypothetical protein